MMTALRQTLTSSTDNLTCRRTVSHRTSIVLAMLTAMVTAATIVPAAPIQAAEGVCIHGSLKFSSPDAESKAFDDITGPITEAASHSKWELYAATTENGDKELIDSAFTSSSGAFSGCSSRPALYRANLLFSAQGDGPWAVYTGLASSTINWHSTQLPTTISTDHDTADITLGSGEAGAWKIVKTLRLLWDKLENDECWVDYERSVCSTLEVVWDPQDPEARAFWNGPVTEQTRRNGRVYLGGNNAESRAVIVHEAGHWLQNALNHGDFPVVDNCAGHKLDAPSSRSCAWTEGFADAVAAYVLGYGPIHIPASGQIWKFESSPGQGWNYDAQSANESTQGNISASLLAIWNHDGDWKKSLRQIEKDRTQTFQEYITTTRPNAGLDNDEAVIEILNDHYVNPL